jgi:hypothetical protein
MDVIAPQWQTPIDLKTPTDPTPHEPQMGPPTPPSQPRMRIPSPFAPMPVQTLAIAPSANLDPVAAPRVEDLLKARTPPKPFVPEPLPPLPGEEPAKVADVAPPKKSGGGGRVVVLLLVILVLLAAGGAAYWKLILKH